MLWAANFGPRVLERTRYVGSGEHPLHDVDHATLRVEVKGHSLRESERPQDSIGLSDLFVNIRNQREGELAFFRETTLIRQGVHGDSHDGDLAILKLRIMLGELPRFAGATERPGFGIEVEDYWPAAQVGKRERLPLARDDGEIGSTVPHGEHTRTIGREYFIWSLPAENRV